jgi:hypothetical protein
MKSVSPASYSVFVSKKMFHEAGWGKTPGKCVKVGETLSKHLAILYKSGRKALFLLESQKE